MARETLVRLIDDLDGGDADETVRFALDGRSYEIDLSMDNAGRLRDSLGRYVVSARSARASAGKRTKPTARTADAARTNDIRIWARGMGHTVSNRGRISKEILSAYHAAH